MSKRKPSWNTIARNRISKDASFGGGDGQFAFVTPCRIVYYTLWQRRDEAEKRKAKVDKTGCGGECKPWTHYIVDLLEDKK